MHNYRKHLKNLVLSAMFLALGVVLPFVTGQIPQIGSMLLPMHIPVILCGLVCSWKYGLAVGLILPVFRSLLFSMPPLYPGALAMSLECAVYGALVGFLFEKAKWKCTRSLYRCLISAMMAGRLVWGLAMLTLMGVGGELFTFSAFAAGAFLNALPGIILQLLLVPAFMLLWNKTHLPKNAKINKNKTKNSDIIQ